jgi:hypothetical protein
MAGIDPREKGETAQGSSAAGTHNEHSPGEGLIVLEPEGNAHVGNPVLR